MYVYMYICMHARTHVRTHARATIDQSAQLDGWLAPYLDRELKLTWSNYKSESKSESKLGNIIYSYICICISHILVDVD